MRTITDANGETGDGSERELDPATAAELLDRTTRDAQRSLESSSPWLTLIAAAVVLIAFGAAWLSVLGQHPYRGPTWPALIVLWVVVLVRILTVALSNRRARSGISGRTTRRRTGETVGLLVALAGVYAFLAALAVAGAGDAIVYGIAVPTATLLALGTFWAARSAVREDRLGLATAVALICVAAGSAFAGPYGVWLSDGIGCCVVLLAVSAVQAARRHRLSAL